MTGSDGAISAVARPCPRYRPDVPTHLVSIVVDSADPAAQARFWSTATGWPAIERRPGRWWAVRPPTGEPGLPIELVQVDDPKVGKNRVHLDLSSGPGTDQAAIVERLLRAGATHADIGQHDVPWIVLADPEGNELCVLEHRPAFAANGSLAAIVIDCVEPDAIADLWSAATGWTAARLSDQTIALSSPDGPGPLIALVRREGQKVVKNRLHLDVAPDAGGDQAAEVQRLLALGATRADVGQGPDVAWVVLADPEGNELCVLQPGAEA